MIVDISYDDAMRLLGDRLADKGYMNAQFMARSTVWLQACGYAGLGELAQALADDPQEFLLKRSVLGLDLHNISCALIGDQVLDDVLANGRVYLQNVRHGLFLLAGSVQHGIGIGCPVDPAFALGGERSKNPYEEKLSVAKRDGLQFDVTLWQSVTEI